MLRPFEEQGHYTGIHDAIFDRVMPVCPPNAWKVLCLIIRKTRGWRKESDRLSYRQIREGTGIKSDATLAKALGWLSEKELITTDTGKDERGRQMPVEYALNRAFELDAQQALPSTENGEPSTENEDGPSLETVAAPTTETVELPSTETEDSNNHPVSQEPQIPVVGIPDDTTTTCLKILLDVKGFPRDQGENAIKLSEYREKFPAADPVEVCEDFRAVIAERPFKPKDNPRLRLRNFFKQANKPRAGNSANGHREPVVSGKSAAERRKEGYEWLFK